MNAEDIVALAKAGFSAHQIAEIARNTPNEKPEEKTDEKPEEKPDEKPEEKPDTRIDDLNAKFDKLLDTFQRGNINGAAQPKKETTDDILAAFINPPRKKEE